MSTSGSPEWENDAPYTAVSDGRRCRIVPIDLDGKHRRSEMGQTWEPFGAPLATAQTVAEFAPVGWSGKLQIRSDPPKQEDAKLPKFLRDRASPPEVAPPVEKAASDPVISWAPFEGDKLAYCKALRDATDLTATEHRMLSNLVTYTDADLGNAFPGHERLGRHMGYDSASAAKQAGRVVRALEAKGYVLQTSSGSNVGVRRAATYRLGLPTPDA